MKTTPDRDGHYYREHILWPLAALIVASATARNSFLFGIRLLLFSTTLMFYYVGGKERATTP
jgi:hypothetical protein